MKAAFLFPAVLAATQFLGLATAAEPSATAARDAEIIKRYDTNKDGKLDDSEVAAVKETMLMKTQEKKEVRRERVKEKQKSFIEEFDTNKDGKLDDAEKAAMDTALRARVEKRPMLLKRLDTDGDGKLSDAEWAAGREKILEHMQEANGKKAK